MAQTCLVTGANRGIGLELARQLAARGETVVGTARDSEAAAELRGLGARVEELDVASAKSVAGLARRLKGLPIDRLVHNAAIGVAGPSAAEVDPEDLETHLRINAIGPLRLTQALLPNLRAGTGKRVIAISSGLGSIAENTTGGWVAYRASKAALHQLMRTFAAELAPEGLVFVLLSPGWVRTGMGGQDAPLSPEQSVGAMLKVIDRLGPKDSGSFFSERGRRIPW
jgi:NAD(P)-dependent dehydrogenase (short-subunit alcohol dehydrogenase family)